MLNVNPCALIVPAPTEMVYTPKRLIDPPAKEIVVQPVLQLKLVNEAETPPPRLIEAVGTELF